MQRGPSIVPKAVAEVVLAAAIVVVLTTDVLDGTPLDRWPFVIGNVVVALVGWVRPAYAGWTLIGLFAVLGLVILVGGDTLDASTMSVVWTLAGPLLVGALFLLADALDARRASAEGRRRGRAWCRVGIHEYVTATRDDERFLRCRHCGKYGGTGKAWGAFTHRE